MALNDFRNRAGQQRVIELSFQADRARHRVGRAGGIHVPEKPQPFLGMGQVGTRRKTRARSAEHPCGPVAHQGLDPAREGRERRRVEEAAQLDLDAEAFADRGSGLPGSDRVSAQHEEIVFPIDGFNPKRSHQIAARASSVSVEGAVSVGRCGEPRPGGAFKDRKTVERPVGPTRAAGRALQLAAGRQRHALRVEQDDDGRIFLCLPNDRFADRMNQSFGSRSLENSAAELRRHANAFTSVDFDRKSRDPAPCAPTHLGFHRRFDVRGIDVLATNDQQVLEPAGHHQRTVPNEAEISGTQPAQAVALHECFVRGFRIIPVSQRDARAGYPDLADLVGLCRSRIHRSA